MAGCANAMRRTASMQCAASVGGGLQELAARRRGREQVDHLDASSRARRLPESVACGQRSAGARLDHQPVRRPAVRLVRIGSARSRRSRRAPRRGIPSCATRSRSSSEATLLVAWRCQRERQLIRRRCRGRRRRRGCAASRRRPAAPRCASAPASTAFSTSSLTTEAGRSITSPAAIWLISASGSSAIGRCLQQSATVRRRDRQSAATGEPESRLLA